MRILVFGAGAIGSLFGGFLSRLHEVALLGRSRHLKAIPKHGLKALRHREGGPLSGEPDRPGNNGPHASKWKMNGAVARLGKPLSVPAPFNQLLTELIHEF